MPCPDRRFVFFTFSSLPPSVIPVSVRKFLVSIAAKRLNTVRPTQGTRTPQELHYWTHQMARILVETKVPLHVQQEDGRKNTGEEVVLKPGDVVLIAEVDRLSAFTWAWHEHQLCARFPLVLFQPHLSSVSIPTNCFVELGGWSVPPPTLSQRALNTNPII